MQYIFLDDLHVHKVIKKHQTNILFIKRKENTQKRRKIVLNIFFEKMLETQTLFSIFIFWQGKKNL